MNWIWFLSFSGNDFYDCHGTNLVVYLFSFNSVCSLPRPGPLLASYSLYSTGYSLCSTGYSLCFEESNRGKRESTVNVEKESMSGKTRILRIILLRKNGSGKLRKHAIITLFIRKHWSFVFGSIPNNKDKFTLTSLYWSILVMANKEWLIKNFLEIILTCYDDDTEPEPLEEK